MASAKAMGCTVKLLASASACDDGDGGRRPGAPGDDPAQHPLAGVGDAFNAVFVEAEAAGQLMFYGRGAGGAPTASAVLGDLVAVARNRLAGGRGAAASRPTPTCRSGRWARSSTRYHISLDVADRAGVLAAVAGAFAEHDVSIQTVRQEGRGDDATLVVVTHAAPDAALAATVEELRGLDVVRAVAERDAGRGRVGEREQCARAAVARADRGVPATGCRSRDATPVVTLHEGSTPLLPAPELSERTGCEVYLKVEGANPTGSFKDRGMTVADLQGGRGRAPRRSSAPPPATPRHRPPPTPPGPA